MVHSAGVLVKAPIRVIKTEDAERMMKLNYLAFLELCKGFCSKKISNNGSSVVALSSFSSISNPKCLVGYSASKAALNTVISIAYKEFAKRGIRVNAIAPANTESIMQGVEREYTDETITDFQPMGEIPLEYIADIIEYLLSDKGRYITGAVIPISAGMEA